MVGIPGSGKTTYAKKNFPKAVYVSRDEVRFSMVSPEEPYFSKEKEVFKEFVRRINEGLRQGLDVVADATHLNPQSRSKLLRALRYDHIRVSVETVWVDTDIDTAIDRNEKRKGTRSYVPKDAIYNMFNAFSPPTIREKGIDKTWIVLEEE